MHNQMQPSARKPQVFLLRNIIGTLLIMGVMGSQLTFAQESGRQIFQQCAACHSIGGGRLVGPDLKDIDARRSESWLRAFIKSPTKVLNSGDKTAKELFAEFNQIPMPDQALSDDQIKSVLAYIKQEGAASPSAGEETPSTANDASSPQAAAVELSPEEIERGHKLFDGRAPLANGGPSCNACHRVENDGFFGGGGLARDLTQVASRIGRQGIQAILGNIPFPLMRAAYAESGLSNQDVNALVGFLQQVDKKSASGAEGQVGGWKLLGAGAGGVIILLLFFMQVGQNRKRRSVNQDIYDRQQIRSE